MTFKLTPGHVDTWLKTRDGRKVKCVLHEDDDFVFMNLNNVYDVWFSKADGYFKDDETEHDKDIIGEWKEPITKEVVVYWSELEGNIDCINVGTVASGNCIASTKVTLTKGVFHDDNK